MAVPHLLLCLVQLWRSGEIMSITNNLTFKALLTTMGRKTGKEHSVWAKAVTYNDMIYFSRRNSNSDWLKNAIANPQVKVEFDGRKISGSARLIDDEDLRSVYGTSAEKALMFHRQNQDVFNSPCSPAIERYTGVVYEHINWPTLSEKSKKYMEKHNKFLRNIAELIENGFLSNIQRKSIIN